MILEAALAIGGLITTIAIGGPIASAMVRPHIFRRPSRPDQFDQRNRTPHTTAFTPLEFGPDPMKWPSQRPWGSSKRLDAQWPSQQWDDEHFGSHWRDGSVVDAEDLGFHAMAMRQYDASMSAEDAVRRNEEIRQQRAEEAKKRKESRKTQSAASAPANAAPLRTGKRAPGTSPERKRGPERAARRASPSRSERRPQAPGSKAKAAPKQAETLPARQEVPPPAELEEMIARLGLAGTVQVIMERTGWDFRKAAHYLARTRQ